MNSNVNLKFYSVYKQDDNFELWGGPCPSKEAALGSGELKILDTYGSKSPKYAKRVNGLLAINESEAKYLKVV